MLHLVTQQIYTSFCNPLFRHVYKFTSLNANNPLIKPNIIFINSRNITRIEFNGVN